MPAALVRRNARVGGKTLSQLSKRELEDAAKAARAKSAKPPTPAAKARQKEEKLLDKRARALLKKAGITRPGIQIKKDVILVSIPRAWLENVTTE